jgi:putative PIN family toxin of toxin-antitoxin system
VLHYPHIQRIKLISENEINKFVHDVISTSQLIEVSSVIDVVKKDTTDNQVLATALDGQASYIVSGDHHLLDLGNFRGIKIVKPIDFLNILVKI